MKVICLITNQTLSLWTYIQKKRDLLNFGNALLHEIQSGKPAAEEPAQWLKSSEVRKLLKISPGTLQNLRINGTLNFNRIGGILYYKYDDLKKLMEK